MEVELALTGAHLTIADVPPDVGQNRRIRLYFEQYLSAQFSGSLIDIPVRGQALGPFVKTVEEALSRHGHQVTRGLRLSSALEGFTRAEEQFARFSEVARRIWEGEVATEEFAAFCDVLIQRLPHRRLYRLQLLAAYHLAFAQNAANFSVPGAGKTSIVYGAFSYLSSLDSSDSKHVNKLLVVGPLSSFGPWELEFNECFGRRPNSMRLSGAVAAEQRKRLYYSESPEFTAKELILSSYQSLPQDVTHLIHFLSRPGNRVMVVLDEAHKIKNVEGGIWAESALKLAPFAAARAVLTGTPAPNGYEDLNNLFRFIWPDRDLVRFSVAHLREMTMTPFDRRIKVLVGNVAPYFIRIRKSDLGLPRPIEREPLVVAFGPKQEAIYRFIEDKYLDFFQMSESARWLKDTLSRARLVRLHQAATNPALLRVPLESEIDEEGPDKSLFLDDAEVMNEILNYGVDESPSKLLAAADLTEQILGRSRTEKVVIWCVFVGNLHAMQELLLRRGIESRLLYGSTPTDSDEATPEIETRESIVAEFMRDDSRYRVVIANPFAVGESISLHKACRNAIYLERNFNAAAFIQSKDRIHRYGLPSDAEVNYYYVLGRNSVDETVHRRLQEKEAAMMRVLETKDIPLLSLAMEADDEQVDDISALVRDYVDRRARG